MLSTFIDYMFLLIFDALCLAYILHINTMWVKFETNQKKNTKVIDRIRLGKREFSIYAIHVCYINSIILDFISRYRSSSVNCIFYIISLLSYLYQADFINLAKLYISSFSWFMSCCQALFILLLNTTLAFDAENQITLVKILLLIKNGKSVRQYLYFIYTLWKFNTFISYCSNLMDEIQNCPYYVAV